MSGKGRERGKALKRKAETSHEIPDEVGKLNSKFDKSPRTVASKQNGSTT